MYPKKTQILSPVERMESGTLDHLERSLLNYFTASSLNRQSAKRHDSDLLDERLRKPSSFLIPVCQSKNLFSNGDGIQPVFLRGPDADGLLAHADSITFLGEMEGASYFAVGLTDDNPGFPDALAPLGQFKDLKSMGPLLDRQVGGLLAYARAMVHWHSRHRFCGDCGSPTAIVDSGHRRVCTSGSCGEQHFPRTDPAIIVLVAHGNQCLLGRQRIWPKDFYSVIAGFVEPGESLEEAVVREVYEETSIEVEEVLYHSSQPWPFPGSVMLGFTGRAGSSSIMLNDHELEDARWFTREEIIAALKQGKLRLPGKISIAYRLIEDWFDAGWPICLGDHLDSLKKQ